jgi:hypothetical protein
MQNIVRREAHSKQDSFTGQGCKPGQDKRDDSRSLIFEEWRSICYGDWIHCCDVQFIGLQRAAILTKTDESLGRQNPFNGIDHFCSPRLPTCSRMQIDLVEYSVTTITENSRGTTWQHTIHNWKPSQSRSTEFGWPRHQLQMQCW